MNFTRRLRIGIVTRAILVGLTVLSGAPAQVASPALTGQVSSAAEGVMEGVLVNAKREGSNMTITVVSNARGVYAFPKDRLEPGRYTLSIRAAGYVLPGREKVVEVTRPATTEANFRLEEAAILEKALQLTSAEWLYSYPLPEETKYATLRDCTRCHSQIKPAMSTYDAPAAAYVMQRMIYSSGSTPASFQLPANQVANWGRPDGVMARAPSKLHHQQAEAVAAINLSKGIWQYPLKTFPRPKGKETQVISIMYDLPRPLAKPHDVEIGPDGWLYYNDFNDNVIGKLFEDSIGLAMLRRFLLGSWLPQNYDITLGETRVADLRQNFNLFRYELNLDFSMDTAQRLDRRLGIAAGVLLAAVEGKQSS